MRYLVKGAYLSFYLGFLSVGISGCDLSRSEPSRVKIVGGRKVTANDPVARSTVGLVQHGSLDVFCSGSLIHPRIVLTAAHCIEGSEIGGFEIDVAFGNQVGRNDIITVQQAVRHQNYNREAMLTRTNGRAPNDIGLLLLSEKAPEEFSPIEPMTLSEDIKEGEDLVLAGFGITRAGANSIDGALRKVVTSVFRLDRQQKEIEFEDELGESACEGDSGGPAFVIRNGVLRLVGVTSRGNASCNGSGIYTDVRYFNDWIRQELQSVNI